MVVTRSGKTTMQQQSLGTFAIRKDVQTLCGRWARERSPEFLRSGRQCKTCGQRFRSQQGLVSHRRHVRNEAHEATLEHPHWAWHFLKGAQPLEQHEDGVPHEVATPERKRKAPIAFPPKLDRRRGRATRHRYTAYEKLHAVVHYIFARENGLEVSEVVQLLMSFMCFHLCKKGIGVSEGLPCLNVSWSCARCLEAFLK